jgi:hypothetical protein
MNFTTSDTAAAEDWKRWRYLAPSAVIVDLNDDILAQGNNDGFLILLQTSKTAPLKRKHLRRVEPDRLCLQLCLQNIAAVIMEHVT